MYSYLCLNRTIIGLKEEQREARMIAAKRFESNYYRIERKGDPVIVVKRGQFESNYYRIERQLP